jgi:plastocyanin
MAVLRAILGFLLAVALSAQTADISGRIRVTSTLTKRRISVPQVYDRTAALSPPGTAAPDVTTELRRVVIFLDTPVLPANPALAVMDQRQRQFEPEVLAIPVGSTVTFPNSDPIFHNVFSLSKARQFDLGNYKAGESRNVTFTRTGVVQIYCHLHPNMTGAVLVTPNSWLTQPAENGDFVLSQVPPGRYTLVAWHKSAGFFRRTIEVRAGHPVSVDFEIPLSEQATR